MKFILTADRELYERLRSLKETQAKLTNEPVSFTDVIEQAVFLLHQINSLLEQDYKLVIIDPDGKEHFIRKKKYDTGKDEGSDREDFEG